jgi:hypothetical protein
MKSLWGGYYGGESISQIACVGDTSDEITSMTVICVYTPALIEATLAHSSC